MTPKRVADSATDVLTVQEAADLARVSPVTIRRWIASGKLPAARPGGRDYRIPEANLKAALGVQP